MEGEAVPSVPLRLSRNCVVASVRLSLRGEVASQFQNDLLQYVRRTGAAGVIIDVSSVEVMDADDFDALRRTLTMVSLMGAQPVLVGLRPGVVSALIELGVDDDGIDTALDLDQGFALIKTLRAGWGESGVTSPEPEYLDSHDAPSDGEMARPEAFAARNNHEEIMNEMRDKDLELEGYRTRVEEQAAQLEDLVEQANGARETKSQFLANMSHELRTPMNAIIGYADRLIEKAQALRQDQLVPDLEKVHTAGKQLLSLINDLLDLSNIETGEMKLSYETFEVNSLLDEIAATVDSLVRKNNNTLELRRSAGLGSMRGDLTKVRRSLFNLLSNACKFTENGSITLTVRRETTVDSDWIEFRVEDTGIGVPEDRLDKLFEEFVQADASTTRKHGGTGVGLAITKTFCEMMGGSITADSEVGKGTTITIKLPAATQQMRAPTAEIPHETAAIRKAAETPTVREQREPEPVFKPPEVTEQRVLVIDDDKEARAALMSTLEADGFEVTPAGSAKEGLDLARRLKPTLITLDVRLPDQDGWALLATIKADPELQHIPVVMVSFFGDREMACSHGAVDALPKPANRDMLRGVVNKYIGSDGRKRALVVEDDEVNRTLLRRTLEDDGWDVVEAENGAVALERLAVQTADVILLDLMMPVMDGFEFAVQLRQREEWRSIPVIVVTAKELTAEDRQRLSGTVERIVQKGSFSLKGFLGQVHELVPPQHSDVSKTARL